MLLRDAIVTIIDYFEAQVPVFWLRSANFWKVEVIRYVKYQAK